VNEFAGFPLLVVLQYGRRCACIVQSHKMNEGSQSTHKSSGCHWVVVDGTLYIDPH
jgi:hypothetical protein